MNILNQSPANGNGHSVFPARRGPRPSSHIYPPHRHHQDACQHLQPVALPLPPASNTLRSLQPSRSTCRGPLVVDSNGRSPPREGPFGRADAASNPPPVDKAQSRRVRSAVVDSNRMEDIRNLPHLLGGTGEDHFKFTFPVDPTTAHARRYDHLSNQYLAEAASGSAAGNSSLVEFEPRSTLGFVPSLVEDDKFSLTQEYYYAMGDHLDLGLDQQLLSPEESPSCVVTLAVSVSSAVKLESKQMDQIAKKMRRLTGFTNLRLENTVDPSLIAGFVISYGVGDEHVIDLSVKSRLAELEARLESSAQIARPEGWNFPSSTTGDSGYWLAYK